MHRHARAAAFIVCTALGWAAPAAAQDPIAYWNERALAAVADRGPTPATIIDMAVVHAAMHDAVQAYDQRFEPYADAIAGAMGSSAVAAAKAAHDVLVNRFPSQVVALDAAYATFVASLTPPPSAAWSTKQQFNFWRPSEAIRRGGEDGNILTEPDPAWTTYFARNPSIAQNPNYPDYTSGANNLTGAMTRMLALFFGSDKPFDSFDIWAIGPAVPLTSDDPNPRIYGRFSDVAKDVIDARVYLGIHFRFADTEARSQGRRVAGHVFRNFLEPVE